MIFGYVLTSRSGRVRLSLKRSKYQKYDVDWWIILEDHGKVDVVEDEKEETSGGEDNPGEGDGGRYYGGTNYTLQKAKISLALLRVCNQIYDECKEALWANN
jgi:hypothetical protein